MAKKITIEDLAILIKRGFQESDFRADKKINDLALMTQKDFDEAHEQFDDIRSQMVTKGELAETREVLARAIKDLEIHLSASSSHQHEEEVKQLKSKKK